MMKKQYNNPKLELIHFDDVILTSGDPLPGVPGGDDNTYTP